SDNAAETICTMIVISKLSTVMITANAMIVSSVLSIILAADQIKNTPLCQNFSGVAWCEISRSTPVQQLRIEPVRSRMLAIAALQVTGRASFRLLKFAKQN